MSSEPSRYRVGNIVCEIAIEALPSRVDDASYTATVYEMQNDHRVRMLVERTRSEEADALNAALEYIERQCGGVPESI